MSSAAPTVIVDRLWPQPSERTLALARTAVLIAAFALLTAALAQFELRLAFTPVPITGQTLGVLLAGGALGWKNGAASQFLYWMLGLTGLPFYAGGVGGWTSGTGATLGYFVGFVVAAAAIGSLAEAKHDRSLTSSWAAMAFGSVIIYVLGAGWLAFKLDVPIATGDVNALSLGVTPFLVGDLIKLLLAGALMPAAWALVRRVE